MIQQFEKGVSGALSDRIKPLAEDRVQPSQKTSSIKTLPSLTLGSATVPSNHTAPLEDNTAEQRSGNGNSYQHHVGFTPGSTRSVLDSAELTRRRLCVDGSATLGVKNSSLIRYAATNSDVFQVSDNSSESDTFTDYWPNSTRLMGPPLEDLFSPESRDGYFEQTQSVVTKQSCFSNEEEEEDEVTQELRFEIEKVKLALKHRIENLKLKIKQQSMRYESMRLRQARQEPRSGIEDDLVRS